MSPVAYSYLVAKYQMSSGPYGPIFCNLFMLFRHDYEHERNLFQTIIQLNKCMYAKKLSVQAMNNFKLDLPSVVPFFQKQTANGATINSNILTEDPCGIKSSTMSK